MEEFFRTTKGRIVRGFLLGIPAWLIVNAYLNGFQPQQCGPIACPQVTTVYGWWVWPMRAIAAWTVGYYGWVVAFEGRQRRIMAYRRAFSSQSVEYHVADDGRKGTVIPVFMETIGILLVMFAAHAATRLLDLYLFSMLILSLIHI